MSKSTCVGEFASFGVLGRSREVSAAAFSGSFVIESDIAKEVRDRKNVVAMLEEGKCVNANDVDTYIQA